MKRLFAIACTLALSLASGPHAHAQKAGGVRGATTGTVKPAQPRVVTNSGRGGNQFRSDGDARTPIRCSRRYCRWQHPH